jgi:hypothetical protein
MEIDFCVQNRQEFGLYRLNQQRFTALGFFYLYFGVLIFSEKMKPWKCNNGI